MKGNIFFSIIKYPSPQPNNEIRKPSIELKVFFFIFYVLRLEVTYFLQCKNIKNRTPLVQSFSRLDLLACPLRNSQQGPLTYASVAEPSEAQCQKVYTYNLYMVHG